MYIANANIFVFGTQHNLYSTDLRLGFVLGVTQILGLASGLRPIFACLDTNMLVYPTQNVRVGGVTQREGFCVAGEYRL